MRLQKQFKINKKMFFVAVGIIAVYIMVFAWAVTSIDRSFYQERNEKINMLMTKVSQNIETAIQGKWDTLHQFVHVFNHHREDVHTLPETLSELERIKDTFSTEVVTLALVDREGIAYRTNGDTHKWSKKELLATGTDQCYISDSENWATNKAVPHLFFVTPLDEIITVDNITFTHMMFSIEMSTLDEYFDTSEFGESSMCFVIRNTGGQIYRQEKDNPLSGVLNILTALSRAKFNYGASIEQVRTEIQGEEGNCVNLEYEGVAYDVAYEKLTFNDWVALLIVPSANSLSGTKSFMNSIISTMVVLAAVTVSIVIMALLTVSRAVNAQLQRVVEAEKAANDAKTRFLSAMSHDIRTPMNAIIGMTNLAMKHMEDREYVQNCLNKVSVSSHHLLTLINDVLDISKVESGKMTLRPVEFSLAHSMSYMVNVVLPQIREKEQNLDIIIHELPHEEVYADQLRVNQIVINLISNAMKYTEVGGDIRIELSGEMVKDNPNLMRVSYVIADNGMGMSEEFQKNMYESFERENTKPQGSIQGTGLGLTICKQMITLLGGTIECSSELGVGTTFVVTLELEVLPERELEQLPALGVLLADDCEKILATASDVMRSFGFKVECASTPEEARAMIKSRMAANNPYDIVIGEWDIVKHFAGRFTEIETVVLISDYDVEGLEEIVKRTGAKGCVGKPYFKSTVHKDISKYLGIEVCTDDEAMDMEDLAGMKILVAEDNDFNWEIASQILDMSQVETHRAANGQECVNIMNEAEDGAYDLILMDIQMPIMNGYEVTMALRTSKREYLKNIPIIAMTADAFSEDVQRCHDVGMNGHIAKPVEINKLIAAIQKNRGGYDTFRTTSYRKQG